MASFKRQFISGVFYTSISKYVGIFVQIIITMILARLLDPSDFGVIAIASVFISFINLLTDFGFGPAIIQSDDLDKKDLSSLFSLTFLIGIVAAIILFLSATPIGDYYNDKQVANVTRTLSVNIIFTALNIVPNALLLKAKRFKFIAIRTLSMQILGGMVGVVFALYGLGLYALVLQSIVYSLGIFLFNYIQNPFRFVNRIYKASIKKVIGFSVFQFMSSIINYITKNIDKPLVGRYLSLSSLGYYEKSYRLMQMPVDNLTYVFTPVMQPIFKDLKHDLKQMLQKYSKLLAALSLVGFPISVALYFMGYDLIHIFYGGKWDAAVIPFQYLSLSVGFMILMSSSGPIYQASNNVRFQLVVNITELVISLVCLFIGLQTRSVNLVAAAISIGIVIRFFSVFSILSIGVFSVSPVKLLRPILPGTLLSFAVGAVFYLLSNIMGEMNSPLRLCIYAVLLLLIIGITLYFNKTLNLKSIIKK